MSEASMLSLYKKRRAKIRLSYLLLDIFLGGFIVGIVLLITLGRPESESQSIGSGGEPFILVEFFWNNKHHIYSPQIYFNPDYSSTLSSSDLLSKLGYAAPWGFGGNTLWFRHSVKKGFLFDSSSSTPFTQLAMDGFHLDSRNQMIVKRSDRDPEIIGSNYGYLWMAQPCPGKWRFNLRLVEEPLDSSTIDIRIKVSYSYGDKRSETVLPGESQTLSSGSLVYTGPRVFQTLPGVNIVEFPLASENLARPECPS